MGRAGDEVSRETCVRSMGEEKEKKDWKSNDCGFRYQAVSLIVV